MRLLTTWARVRGAAPVISALDFLLVLVLGLVVSSSLSPAFAAEPTVAECLSASDRATALKNDGRYRAARTSFLTCVADTCPSVVRRDCVTSLTELEQLQPSFVFAVQDERGNDVSEVRVSMDGELLVERLDGKPINVDVGPHVFTFVAGPRYREHRVSVLARTTEKNRVVAVRLEPRIASTSATSATSATQPTRVVASPEGLPVMPLVLGTVGVVALGTFAYLGLSARNDLDALEADPCAASKTCDTGDVDSIRTRFALADVALGVGAVSLVAAAWLWFSRDHAPVATARGVGVRF